MLDSSGRSLEPTPPINPPPPTFSLFGYNGIYILSVKSYSGQFTLSWENPKQRIGMGSMKRRETATIYTQKLNIS